MERVRRPDSSRNIQIMALYDLLTRQLGGEFPDVWGPAASQTSQLILKLERPRLKSRSVRRIAK